MSEKTLKFNNITVNKEEFHKSKQPIYLSLVIVDRIVISDKFKHSDNAFKYFLGYQKSEIVKSLCIILPQMTGYIKYFENGEKNVSFLIKGDPVLNKYNEIWDKIKEKLSTEFHSESVYDQTYIKAKVREFDGKIKTDFLGNGVPKENMYYTCIACVAIDSVMRIDQKNHPEIYLEECKYRVKKIQMSRLINAELESDSDSDSDSKLHSGPDSDSGYDKIKIWF